MVNHSENPASERVYIGGLPAGLDEPKLCTIIGSYGTVRELKYLPTKAACIVNFTTLEEAKWVVENLDGNMPEGIPVPLCVKFANPLGTWIPGKGGSKDGGSWGAGAGAGERYSPYGGKGAEGGKGGKGGSIQTLKNSLHKMGLLPGSQGKKADSQQLYVRGLPSDTSDVDLSDIFAPFGAIPSRGVKAMLNNDGMCSGIGFVDFIEEHSAAAASEALNGTQLPDGNILRVVIKNSTYKGKGKGDEGKGEGKGKGKGKPEDGLLA